MRDWNCPMSLQGNDAKQLLSNMLSNVSSKNKIQASDSDSDSDEDYDEFEDEGEGGMFDIANLRESENLGIPPNEELLNASDLRASQLRLSRLQNKIDTTSKFVSENPLTQSQLVRKNLYLGNLKEMRERIVQLVSVNEDEELCGSLLLFSTNSIALFQFVKWMKRTMKMIVTKIRILFLLTWITFLLCQISIMERVF